MRHLIIIGLIALMATTAHAGAFTNAVEQAKKDHNIVLHAKLVDEENKRHVAVRAALSHVKGLADYQPKLQGTAKMRFNGKTVDDLTTDAGFQELMAFKIGVFKALHTHLQGLYSQTGVKADDYDWAKLMANALRQSPGANTGSAFLLLLAELEKTLAGREMAETLRTDYADLLPAARWDVADAGTIEPAAGDDKPLKQGYRPTELVENDFLVLKGTGWFDDLEPGPGETELEFEITPPGDEEDVVENPNTLSPNTPLTITPPIR